MIDSTPRKPQKANPKKHKTAGVLVLSTASHASGSELGCLANSSNTVDVVYPTHIGPKLVVIERVCEILGLRRSAVHAKVATGELPAPIKFGTSRRSAARWLEHEIVAFVMSKAASRKVISQIERSKGNR